MTVKDPKKISFIMSAFIALGMLWFEVEKTQSIEFSHFHGFGHFLVLTGLNAGGLVLFFLAGILWEKSTAQASIIFFFSVCLRVFVGYYIETLQLEDVFASGERWTMHAGNIVLAFIEISFAFTQTKGNETEERISKITNEYESQIDAIQTQMQLLKDSHEKSLMQAKDDASEEVIALNEELVHEREAVDLLNSKIDALEKALEANAKASENWERISHAVGSPQLFGTRYRTITEDGVIVACNRDGKVLNGVKVKS